MDRFDRQSYSCSSTAWKLYLGQDTLYPNRPRSFAVDLLSPKSESGKYETLWASQLCLEMTGQSLSSRKVCVSITREATADGRLRHVLDTLFPKLKRWRTRGLHLRSIISRHCGSQTFKNACRWKKSLTRSPMSIWLEITKGEMRAKRCKKNNKTNRGLLTWQV
jgi:hypothetical protein